MAIAYFDCFSGASGDMIIGALLDAGASLAHLKAQLATLPVGGFDITAEAVKKQGFAATAFHVEAEPQEQHRHLGDITKIIQGSALSAAVQAQSCQIFTRLAEAEARVHGTDISQVHFHEVGAIDAIVDVVGACVALESLDVDEVYCSPIPTGSGTVHCAHGVLPVPAPATAELLKDVPLESTTEVGELTTPTGAAVLTTLAKSFTPLPPMTLQLVGYGAGRRAGVQRPNLLRVLVGAARVYPERDAVVVMHASIDDQDPQVLAFALERLLEAGALDACCQPIYMKKGRPGLLLTVLCEPGLQDALETLIFAETSTFGIRSQVMQRSKLDRRHDEITLPYGPVRIKVGSRQGQMVTAAPEYEDCRLVAERSGRPLRDVMALALRQWEQHRASESAG